MEFIYSDDWLFAVNKPSGVAVHRGWAREGPTLVDILRTEASLQVVHPVGRLDRGASGVSLFARSPMAACWLQALLHPSLVDGIDKGESACCRLAPDECCTVGPDANVEAADGYVRKRYIVLVRGCTPSHGTINHPIPQKEGGSSAKRVPALTSYHCVGCVHTAVREVSLVEVTLLSGRLHQIRRHMKHIGHPVIGDSNYGRPDLNRSFAEAFGLGRLALHCSEVTFPHPWTGRRITIMAPIPPDMAQPLSRMGFPTIQ